MRNKILGNEENSYNSKLNPKIFERDRNITFNGFNLEDSENNVPVFSLVNYKKNIKNLFTYENNILPGKSLEFTADECNMIISNKNANLGYFRKGEDKDGISINYLIHVSLKDLVVDAYNSISCKLVITFIPKDITNERYIEFIKSKNPEFAEIEKVFKNTNEEKQFSYEENVIFVIQKDSENLYKTRISKKLSTKDQKTILSIDLEMVYDLENNKVICDLISLENVGLIHKSDIHNDIKREKYDFSAEDYASEALLIKEEDISGNDFYTYHTFPFNKIYNHIDTFGTITNNSERKLLEIRNYSEESIRVNVVSFSQTKTKTENELR